MARTQLPIADNLSLISQILDSIGLSLLGWLCHGFYHDTLELPSEYIYLLILNALLILVVFPYFDLYSSWRGRNKFSRSSACAYAWSTVIVSILVLTFSVKTTATFSRVWFLTWWTSGMIYLIVYRQLMDIILNDLRARGINRKKILIYGAGKVGKNVGDRLREEVEIGFDISAYIDDNVALQGTLVSETKVLPPDQLLNAIKDVQELWIALPFNADKRVQEILWQTRHNTLVVRFIPDIFHYRLLNHSVTEIAGIPIININGTPMSNPKQILKRIEDLLLSTIILVLISPVMLLIALLIKLTSKGPVFYKQKRHGWDGKTINVYKFRSMYYAKDDQFKQATKNDSRITPIGKFIRATSIDELPQFFNVVQGRMSIVGPRPHAISMNEEFKDQVDGYMQRHKVKPGITGWAQINGYRGETDTLEKMEKRIEYDLYYIENWSIFLDLRIILLTIFKGFVNKNAY
ncbi:MAG TPA: undecaprenyl-phosphate glucose phosphotransferase [Bacteriovoracaceae bacterium]|nr:undecaprenyl-phosphate glucose phosphotransferase [Bacteriovoracaceae bacterium]